ncbi:MAG: hypothetical protein AAGJ35_09415 [Myxococcota bacterium]
MRYDQLSAIGVASACLAISFAFNGHAGGIEEGIQELCTPEQPPQTSLVGDTATNNTEGSSVFSNTQSASLERLEKGCTKLEDSLANHRGGATLFQVLAGVSLLSGAVHKWSTQQK